MPAPSTRALLLVSFLLAGRLASGQALLPKALYPTAARSDAWMDSVRRLPLPRQIAAIRARVLADTVLRHPYPAVCTMPLTATQRATYDRAQRLCNKAEAARPAGQLLLYSGDGYNLSTNDRAQTLAFVRELDSRAIRRVELLKSSALATALYGTLGAGGVVVLAGKPAPGR